ncbi:restriction endonuclease subunit S, partial [Anaerolinea sp.]|uniref:restriction endonuclease subunit S n=1 Tax=Anaerolinea sp. TaxID=1872519 RepID=UPI002ACE239C
PKAFSIWASELADRFDVSFHVPIARTVVKGLHEGEYAPVRLGDMAANIFIPPRFKRIYVPKEYGIPFLQGSHLPQVRPYDLKYISLKANAKHIDECLIKTGYVLVTRSGTIGRIGLVSSYKDKWAATDDLVRIVPDHSKGHPGYIAAFLMTPYGQHQLKVRIYGGVIDHLEVPHVESVLVPNPPQDIQTLIGERVVQAFEKKDKASAIEEAAIRKVERLLTNRQD